MIKRSTIHTFLNKTTLLILCFCLLMPHQSQAAKDKKKENNDPFSPTLYLDEPEWETLFKKEAEKDDGFNINHYYDSLEPPHQDGMLGRYSILAEDSLYFLVPAVAVLGVLYVMPEDVTNWDPDKITWEHGSENWRENVSSWEWDSDDNWINYIGHPYFGSTYFIYARHYGYSRFESFCFSLAISSFYEIGLEAWAEPVSIQDMIFTPILGWGLAEILLPIEHHIKENDKKVCNSRILGATTLFLIDPFGHIVPMIKTWTDSLFSSDTEVSLNPMLSRTSHLDQRNHHSQTEERYGLQLTVRW